MIEKLPRVFLCQSIFNPQSEQADRLNQVNNYFIIASSFILVAVIVILIYASIKFRAKPGDKEPRQFKNSKLTETIMIGIPFLMVSYFFYLTLKTMYAVEPSDTPGNHRPTVVITGKQWWWRVYYPGSEVVTANEIHLPAGKPVLIKLLSADVIHDWWVPSFGAKKDMVPGSENYLWVTIKKPGVYQGACSEFCGKQHAWMRIRVVAQAPADFSRWLAERGKPARAPFEPGLVKGAAIFSNTSCANCHSIRGTGASGEVGPDLTHFAARTTMLAGRRKNNPGNVYEFLNDPQKVKPGAHMPRFIYKQDTIKALTEYLSSLK